MSKKIALIGFGWVGHSMASLFPEARIYDPAMDMSTKEQINECDIAFISVPTPNADNTYISPNAVVRGEGALDTSIVEESIAWCECPLLVIRSTVNPGDTDYWAKKYNKRIVVQPEYLGETPNHPLFDPKERQFMILGGDRKDTRELINLYMYVYNANIKIRQVSALEAEVIKITENRAIAFKVAQMQELYDVCDKAGVDYYTIRDAVYGDDPRFDLWFSFVYPGARGMNSKCIPKDIFAWCAFAESLGYEPKITRAILEKNKEWLSLKEEDTAIPESKEYCAEGDEINV
jgi:UDPglucose 6-dehydrogenase